MSGLGQLVESLGVTLTLADDDLVTDIVLIAQVLEADGSVKLAICDGDATSWITRTGMIQAAMQIDSMTGFGAHVDGDDDE